MKRIVLFLIGMVFIASSLAVLYNSNGMESISGFLLLEQPEDIAEKSSPYDRVKEDQISVYDSLIIMHINKSEIVSLEDTNSMVPLVDKNSNAIQIKPKNPEDIHIGDIVSYQDSSSDAVIMHRVVEISEDSKGKYFVLKGDNVNSTDSAKVRFGQIKGVVVAIIY